MHINLVMGVHFSKSAVLFKRDLTRNRYGERHSKLSFLWGTADYNDEQKLGFLGRGQQTTVMSNEDAWCFPIHARVLFSSNFSVVLLQTLLLSSHSLLREAAINIKIEGISYRISLSGVVSELCR